MNPSWQPSTTNNMLQARAALLATARQFFAKKNVLEVETPLLAKHTVSAPHLASFKVQQGGGYLQTSPEYAMKRLLAAGSGDIYQICKAFRQAERGTQHNSEFSILEWYRLGFSAQQLIDEIVELLKEVLGDIVIESISYRDAFIKYADIDPFAASFEALEKKAHEYIEFQFVAQHKDDYLDLLLTHCVQKKLGGFASESSSSDKSERLEAYKIFFLTDFPATQAALAKTKQQAYGQTAERFEVFINGFEIANAYVELSDPGILKQRWQEDNDTRMQLALAEIDADEYLIAAQQHGLPECAGVALGLDRLLMLAQRVDDIEQVISFTDERA